MCANVVDKLHEDFTGLRDFLGETNGARFLPVVEGYLPRTMLLAAASYFERRLSDEVERLAEEKAGDGHVLTWLIRKKVLSRQYHTWFDWKKSNVNLFLSMFGQDFKNEASKWIAENEILQRSSADFLEIGRERNRLIHNNFGDAPLEKTTADVYGLYKSAKIFVDWFPGAIRRYSHERMTSAGS